MLYFVVACLGAAAASASAGPIAYGPQQLETRANARGTGWILEDRVFSSVPFGLRVSTGAGWHVVTADALSVMAEGAEVGLVSVEPQSWLCLIPERACSASADDLVSILNGPLEGFRAVADPPLPFSFDDVELELRHHAAVDAPQERVMHGVFRRGELVCQVLVWFRQGERRAVERALPAAARNMRFLTPRERVDLGLALASTIDPENQVTRTSTLRRGVYRDFRFGFTWSKPPDALWRANVSEAVTEDGGRRRLVIEEPLAGITGELTVWPGVGTSVDQAHSDGIACYLAPITPGETSEIDAPSEPERVRFGRRPARLSSFTSDTPSGRFAFRLVTMVYERRAYEFVFHGLECNVERSEALIRAAWKSLVLHPEKLAAIDSDESSVRDLRFGFELRAPGPDWVRGSEPRLGDAIATSATWVDDRGSVLYVLAHYVGSETGETDLPLHLLPNGIVDQWAARGTRTEISTSMHGYPALQQTYAGVQRHTEVVSFVRERVMYTIVIESAGGEWTLADAEQLFGLLP